MKQPWFPRNHPQAHQLSNAFHLSRYLAKKYITTKLAIISSKGLYYDSIVVADPLPISPGIRVGPNVPRFQYILKNVVQ